MIANAILVCVILVCATRLVVTVVKEFRRTRWHVLKNGVWVEERRRC